MGFILNFFRLPTIKKIQIPTKITKLAATLENSEHLWTIWFRIFILAEKKVMSPILSVECILYEIQMVAPCKIVPFLYWLGTAWSAV